MAILRTNASDEFQRITKYNIIGYFSLFARFARFDMNNIWRYYSGLQKSPNMVSFRFLDTLLKETYKLKNIISLNSKKFSNIQYWELLDRIEQINVVLEQTENASKFLRSSIVKGNFSPNTTKEVTLRQNQTLEQLAKESGYDDSQNSWTEIALDNDLIEEDYTLDGGNTLEVRTKNRQSIFLSDVIDNITGERMYGKDLNRKISFENEDLAVLTYKETIYQAIDILAGLNQGGNPEYDGHGIDARVSVGSNISAFNYPSLFRQFVATFNNDDTISSVSIENIEFNQGDLFITYQVQTVLGEILENRQAQI